MQKAVPLLPFDDNMDLIAIEELNRVCEKLNLGAASLNDLWVVKDIAVDRDKYVFSYYQNALSLNLLILVS